MNIRDRILSCLVLTFCLNTAVFGVEMKPSLTLDMAKKMADVCEAKAIKEGWRKVSIAIYDDSANLLLFRRQDGAFFHSAKVARAKAYTSSGFPFSTRAFGDLAYKNPDRPHGIEEFEGFVMFPGGVPVLTKDGVLIGGIGVSGATADQDESCAEAGIEAVGGQL